MPRKEKLYQLTDGDRAIFERARKLNDPSIITNYYLRNEDTGTYWRPVTQTDIDELQMTESKQAAQRWRQGYEQLYDIWVKLGKPDFYGPDLYNPTHWLALPEKEYHKRREELDRVYRVQWELELVDPIFHHPHGKIFIPWQLDMHRSKHPIIVEIGGFGSAKTYGKIMTMLVRAITLPGYRALAIAPFSLQANEVHKLAVEMIEGTLFERFVVGTPTRPQPQLILGNSLVGQTSIECYPGDDPGKFLTLTVDEALVDQAEKMDGAGTSDIDTLVRSLGSRFRGLIKGRPRVGQITFLANSADNPQLWDLYDESNVDPDYIRAHSPATFDNIYLTVSDLKRFEKQVGKDDYQRGIHLKGERPIGTGEHFSRETLEKCHDRSLDTIMVQALRAGVKGAVRQEAQRVAVHKWELPYEEGRHYVVAADAGYGNPPERNSPVVAVFDVTNFPEQPAVLRAFSWVYGNHSPNPFITQYVEYVNTYKAAGNNGYDATGPGGGYERMKDFEFLFPMPVQLGGQGKKATYLNLIKKLMADGKILVPNIPHLFSQCSKYRTPDDKLRQDIVAMLIVLAAVLESRIYPSDDSVPEAPYDINDRDDRPEIDFDPMFYSYEEI